MARVTVTQAGAATHIEELTALLDETAAPFDGWTDAVDIKGAQVFASMLYLAHLALGDDREASFWRRQATALIRPSSELTAEEFLQALEYFTAYFAPTTPAGPSPPAVWKPPSAASPTTPTTAWSAAPTPPSPAPPRTRRPPLKHRPPRAADTNSASAPDPGPGVAPKPPAPLTKGRSQLTTGLTTAGHRPDGPEPLITSRRRPGT
ncbi:hypothetical protein [Streptomyces termitum]|uniref:hypothetical protein n=1 Tax=Streptomyces termitum TaxID=67368 RepID=UPI0033B061ED